MGTGGSKKKEEEVTSTHDEKKRTHIATEIVETERSYVSSLQTLTKNYLQPLKEAAATDQAILTTNEIKDLFGIIEVILNFHATLLVDLDDRLKKWSPSTCLGDIFAKNNAFFKMISTYVNSYNQALMTYYQCKNRSKTFAQFLDKTMAAGAPRMLDLQSYLIMPVQRLPRYVLLLTELVKYSNPKHPGYPLLTDSLEAVKKVADFVNEEKKNAENSLKMLQIQENLVGKRARPILQPTRRYYDEGHFTWVNSSRKEPRPLQYFLFNDSILLATPEKSFFQSTPDKWKLKTLEPLVSVEMQEATGEDGNRNSKFDIRTPSKTFSVEFDQNVNVDEWIEVFYWLRSGCGPRYEKVSAEAQKRNFRKSDTLEYVRPQKKKDKEEESSPYSTMPRGAPEKAPLKTDVKLDAKSDIKVDTKVGVKVEPKQEPKTDSNLKQEPPKLDPKLKASAEIAKSPNPPTSSSSSKSPPSSSAASAQPKTPAKPVDTNPPPPSSPKQDAKGKAPESPKVAERPKPPRPKSPPPPKRDASKNMPTEAPAKNPSTVPAKSPPVAPAKKPPAEAPSASSSPPPIERRPSLTSSFSAFFGIKSEPSTGPSPPVSPASSPPPTVRPEQKGSDPKTKAPEAKGTEAKATEAKATSPVSPRNPKPPAAPPSKK